MKICFGNVHENMKKAREDLISIQNSIEVRDNSEYLQLQEKEAQLKLDKVMNLEEAFWRESVRVN